MRIETQTGANHTSPINLAAALNTLSSVVRSFSVPLNNDVDVLTYVDQLVSLSNDQLRRVKICRRNLQIVAAKSSVNCFAVSRVDNALLASCHLKTIHELHTVINSSNKFDPSTSLL